MITAADKIKKYSVGGVLLSKRVQYEVGDILFAERCRRQMTLEEVCEKTELVLERVEKLEQGQKLNWCVLAALLEFYGKRLEVRLVDRS